MAGENDQAIIEVKEAVGALREVVEKSGVNSPEYKEMVEKTQAALERDEKVHAEMIAEREADRKKALELEEQLKDLEMEVVNISTSGQKKENYKDTAEYKALQQYVQFGIGDETPGKGIGAEECKVLGDLSKTMRMDDATQGGYLTTTEMDNFIIKKITEISPVRQVARVRSVSKKTLEVPTRATIPTASYEGEAAAGDDDNSTYGNEQLTTYRLTVTVPFTMDLLGDSAFDLEAEINGDVTEAMAQKEGNKFVLGTGAKQPEGFLVNATVAANVRTTLTSLTIGGDDLILLTGDLKQGYNPMYAFNRATLAFLRTLKGTTNDHYIWQPSLVPGAPNTLNGEPYIVFPDMPNYGVANNLSVVYADFLRGYTITDRTGTMIIRDQYAKKRQAIIEITFHRWNTGQVVLPEAFKALKTKS